MFNEIIEKIEMYQTIIIHRHQNPDPDALGSQSGLKAIIATAFPNKKVYEVGGPVGDLDWITTMDTIPTATYRGALVIVCDTANTPRISDDRFNKGDFLIKIDHHPDDDHYGDLVYVDPDASSTSELITRLVNASAGKLRLTDKAARSLYAGIVGDTGRFLYPSTSPETFKVAGQLVAYHFSHTDVSRQMSEVSLQQAKLEAFVYDHLTLADNGAGFLVISQQLLQQLGVSLDQVNAIVSTPGHLKVCRAWLMGVEQADGHYRVHLRSKGAVINQLAKAHNGGGHPLASGAKAKDLTELQTMFSQLQQLVTNYQKTEDK